MLRKLTIKPLVVLKFYIKSTIIHSERIEFNIPTFDFWIDYRRKEK